MAVTHSVRFGVVVMLFVTGSLVFAQFEQIIVEDVRPIYKAVGLVEDRCHCVITYEDPRYKEKQVVDKTPKVLPDGTPPRRRSLFPPRAFFSFQYDLAAASQGREAVARNLDFALTLFNNSRKDGVAFRLMQSPTLFHVVPATGSLLSTPVTLTMTQGSGTENIRAIVDSVSKVTGERIYTNGRERLLQYTVVTLSTNSAPASDLLGQVLAGTPERRLSWKLLFQLEYGYVLNISNLAVPAEQRQ